ncbi:MAG: M28 family peptidase [Gemmatimonadetes bacterium]|nr:M28 family peptidase [Gemmatimonadota bacterium]
MRLQPILTPAFPTAALCFALASAADAQSSSAWLGAHVPNGLAAPGQHAVLDDGHFSAPAATVPSGEEGARDLDGTRIYQDLAEIVGFAHASRARGDLMWGRVSGFRSAVETADWVAARFREAGLRDVAVQRYSADKGSAMWWPDHWEVRVLADPALGVDTRDVVLGSAVPARGAEIPGRLLTAPVIFAGDAGSLLDHDVTDKVAVQRIQPASGAFGQRDAVGEGAAELYRRGAVAVLNYIDQAGNMHVRDFGGCRVCFNIGSEDGAFLRDVSERAARAGKLDDLRIRLYLDATARTGLSAQNVMGIVPGVSSEIVIVNAHLDGWYDAAGDNGDGLAVLVALARHFARPENRPARTLLFVASGGHHSTGLNGPSHFVAMNPELTGRAVLVLNLEHIAQFLVDPGSFEVQRAEQSMGWGVTNMAPPLLALTDRAKARFGFALRPQYSTSVAGDLGGYASLGVPRVQAIHAGPLYHTSGDVLESISVEGLERAARFYASWTKGVTEMSRTEIDP